jgi:hypothetical protein
VMMSQITIPSGKAIENILNTHSMILSVFIFLL